MVSLGQPAPDFTLTDTTRQPVSLSNYRGRNVVLLFFPLAFTSVCTAELCAVRDNYHDYEALNTDVLAVSVDSPFALEMFKKEQNFPFPLLSDFNKTVSKAYGTLYDTFFGMEGVSKRAAFVIDQSGLIQYAEILEDAGKVPNFDAIQAALK